MPRKKIVVRLLRKDDAPQVAGLILAEDPTANSPHLIDEIERLSYLHGSHPIHNKPISNSRGVIAVRDGLVLGFAHLAWHTIPGKGPVATIERLVGTNGKKIRGLLVGKIKEILVLERIYCLRIEKPSSIVRKLINSGEFHQRSSSPVKTIYYERFP